MADNIAITAGTGTTVATDDVSGVHYQRMKLHTAEADSAEGIGDTDMGSTRALWVDQRLQTVAVQATVSGLATSATYAADDQVGTEIVFAGMARANGLGGLITTCLLIDESRNYLGGELWLFDQSVTPAADSAAFSFSDADALHVVGVVPIPYGFWNGGNLVCQSTPGLAYKCASGSTSLYGYLVTRSALGAGFGSTTAIKMKLLSVLD